jgi:hypothetical protein
MPGRYLGDFARADERVSSRAPTQPQPSRRRGLTAEDAGGANDGGDGSGGGGGITSPSAGRAAAGADANSSSSASSSSSSSIDGAGGGGGDAGEVSSGSPSFLHLAHLVNILKGLLLAPPKLLVVQDSSRASDK